MGLVYVGKIVATHGIKGEIRLLSDFFYKEKAFMVGSFVFIDGEKYRIYSYRRHKNYDMITLDGFFNINDVSFLISREVYKEREDLHLAEDEVLDSDLLDYVVLSTLGQGIVREVFLASPTNKILRVEIADREILIPFSSPYLEIDYKNHKIMITMIDGM